MYELSVKPGQTSGRRLGAASALALTVLAAGPAYAHKVNMFAFPEGDRILVEGYFSDGKRAHNSAVDVFSPSGEVLVHGKTDDEGSFSFEIPQSTDLRIRLNAGMGHQTEYTITKAELTGMPPPTAGDSGDEGAGQANAGDVAAPSPGGGATVDQAVIRRAVGEAILPVMRSLSELKERRTISDIIGGIGFIVGIMGVFFYLKARKLTGGSASGN